MMMLLFGQIFPYKCDQYQFCFEVKYYLIKQTSTMEKKIEKPAVIKLKENMSIAMQSHFNNETLERFLISHKNNIEQTLKNLNDYMAWQEDLSKEGFLSEVEIRNVKTLYPHGYSGVDIEGRPVYVELVGKIKLTELFKIVEDNRLLVYFAQRMEHLQKQIFPHVQKKQLLVILDLKGQIMKMASKRVYNLIESAINSFQRYYPETLYHLYLVNTSALFETTWSTIKKNIAPETLNKITLLGSEFEDQIGKIISKANLPETLGGKIDDIDFAEEDHGPWVKNKKREEDSDSEEEEFDMEKLKAALSGALPKTYQEPHGSPQTPLNTEQS